MPPDLNSLRRERDTFRAINIIAALAVATLFWAIVHQQHQITRNNQAIQQQRYDFVLRDCLDQNTRHDNTIGALDAVLGHLIKQAKNSAEVQRLRTARTQNVLLINALAPHQNCQALAALATGKKQR